MNAFADYVLRVLNAMSSVDAVHVTEHRLVNPIRLSQQRKRWKLECYVVDSGYEAGLVRKVRSDIFIKEIKLFSLMIRFR